ncbi:MAG: substrate-binding domain-containing protein [Flavobacteriales bacterium]
MKKFKIGGVPEHFNLPWYLTLKNKEYTAEGINLRWIDFFGGTGQMSKALRDKEIDMAVILTEGIIREINNGNDCKIVQVFVKSPLIWGVHVASNSSYKTIEDLKGTKAAISRYGSGSHLMSYVHAENNHWNLETDLKFEVIKNLEGALKNLPKGNGDYFLWEKFTTKPYVDQGILKLLGTCPTPWPCFVIAVRNELLEKEEESIKIILDIINKTTLGFKNIPSIDMILSNRYQQKLLDIQQWLELTNWSQEQLKIEELNKVQNQLLKLNLIKDKSLPNNILHNF